VKPVLDLQAMHGCQGESDSVVVIGRPDRERKAYALRQQGWTFGAIAAELEYSDRSAACKAAERGRLRWMRETDAGRRAGELERFDVLLALLWPSINRPVPDPKAMDQAIKLMSLRGRIMGVFGKPVETPDTYASAPNGAEPGKAHKVNRYIELVDEMMVGVIEAGYGSGIRRPGDHDDEDDDATTGVTGSDLTVADDGRKKYPEVREDMHWADGELVWDGEWIDGKFFKSTSHAEDDDALDRHPRSPTTPKDGRSDPLRAEALRIDS
jgi:hypothetical protein